MLLVPPPLVLAAKNFVLIDRTTGANIGNMTSGGGLAAAFDGNTAQSAAAACQRASAVNGYVGKNLSAARVIGKAVLYPNTTSGFVGSGITCTMSLRASNSAPTAGTDGTLLASLSFTDTGAGGPSKTLTSSDLATAYKYVWVYITTSDSSVGTSELQLYAWE